MGKITEMRDRRDINRKADLRRILDILRQNLNQFNKILNQVKEKDFENYKKCIRGIEDLQDLLIKLDADSGRI